MSVFLRRIVIVNLICAVLFGAATTAHAQLSAGGLRGVVKDESGGVLAAPPSGPRAPPASAARRRSGRRQAITASRIADWRHTITFTLQGFRRSSVKDPD